VGCFDGYRETALYHLYNLAWFFRRRLLERELQKLDVQLSSDRPDENKVQNIIRDISNDFRTLRADAQVRGMEDPARAIDAFEPKIFGPALQQEVKRYLEVVWPPLDRELFSHIQTGDARQISKTLHSMEEVNHFCLKVSAEGLNKYLEHNDRQH